MAASPPNKKLIVPFVSPVVVGVGLPDQLDDDCDQINLKWHFDPPPHPLSFASCPNQIRLQNVFVQIAKCIYTNYKMYL